MATEIEKINVEKHYLNQTSAQIKAITQPLQQCGIIMFDHFRIYDDNSAIDLTTSPEFCDYYARNKLYFKGCAGNYDDYHDGYFFWDTLLGASPVFEAIEQQCHIAHGITIVKTYPDYCDHFYLGGASDNPQIKNFFINQKDTIEQFIQYYYLSAESLITNARQHAYIFPNGKKECDEILSPCTADTYTIHLVPETQKIQITSRERQCIHYSIQGKSAKLVANELNISQRTVERHLENLYAKFGVRNKLALLNKLTNERKDLFL